MKNQQKGFTLVEIAIVLVIIGLLMGGVLKGQELINSAKVKNLANDFRTIPVFIYGYQDKFKRLPGDDPNADTRFSGGKKATASSQTVGSGIIETIHTGCMRQSRPRFATPFWTYNLNGTKSAQQFFQSPVCNARTIFRHF